MYTSDQIINVLKKVTYPGKGDIVTLGMVEKAEHGPEMGPGIDIRITKAHEKS